MTQGGPLVVYSVAVMVWEQTIVRLNNVALCVLVNYN